MRLLVTALAVLALVGCSESLDQGTIIEKLYEERRAWTTYIPIKTSEICTTTKIGETTYRNCTPIYTNLPFHHVDDEDWVFVVQDGEKKGKVYVTKETWDSLSVGEYWSKDGTGSLDDPIRRERVDD